MKRWAIAPLVLGMALSVVGCKDKGEGNGEATTAVESVQAPAGAPAAGDEKPAKAGGPFVQENSPDNLKALLTAWSKSLSDQDAETFMAMWQKLAVDETSVKKGLKDDVPSEVVAKVLAMAKEPITFEPTGAEVEVHGATAKEIDEQNTPESGHFSGNDQDAAREYLRPDVTYYNATVGDRTLHLLFWDGAQWRMLGHIRSE